jgi:hypothetical protein
MSHDRTGRTGRILELVGIALEARSCLAAAGLNATTGELLEFARLISMREMRERELEFVAGERWLREPTVN